MLRVLIFVVSFGARALRAMCRRRPDLVIENLALRQPGDSCSRTGAAERYRDLLY